MERWRYVRKPERFGRRRDRRAPEIWARGLQRWQEADRAARKAAHRNWYIVLWDAWWDWWTVVFKAVVATLALTPLVAFLFMLATPSHTAQWISDWSNGLGGGGMRNEQMMVGVLAAVVFVMSFLALMAQGGLGRRYERRLADLRECYLLGQVRPAQPPVAEGDLVEPAPSIVRPSEAPALPTVRPDRAQDGLSQVPPKGA